jgi:hypothetical protein
VSGSRSNGSGSRAPEASQPAIGDGFSSTTSPRGTGSEGGGDRGRGDSGVEARGGAGSRQDRVRVLRPTM